MPQSKVPPPFSAKVNAANGNTVDYETPPLSKEVKAFIERNNAMRKSYQMKAEAIVRRAIHGELDEEDLNLASTREDAKIEDGVIEVEEGNWTGPNFLSETEFRDEWLSDLATLVQGRCVT